MVSQKKPLEKYRQYERKIASTMNELLVLTEDEFHFKPNENSWSASQVLNHLIGVERGTLHYLRKKLKYGGIPKAGLLSMLRNLALKGLLYSPIRYKIPSVLSQPSDGGSLESISNQWSELRKEWKNFLENFPNEYLDKAVFRHPIVGRISISQTVDFLIAHYAHHLKQLRRIKKSRLPKKTA